MINPSHFSLKFKAKQFEKSENFQDISIAELPEKIKAYSSYSIENGYIGIYWKSEISGPDGKYYQPIFDIESRDSHSDIGANIDAALGVRFWLSEKGLTPGLQIILSGAGFRFIWPFLIPGTYWQPLRSLIRSLPDTDQSSPSNFQRIFAYRGNAAQGRGKKDIHTHLLPDPDWLDSLTEAEYRELTAGKPKHADYCTWISRILPTAIMPEAWEEILSEFRSDERLRNSLISIPKISSHKKAFDMQIARTELDRRGISFKEMQAGGIEFVRISVCPLCNRKDSHPFIPPSGRLKCHSVNCDAGQRAQDGRIEGIPPWEWISDYKISDNNNDEVPKPEGILKCRTLPECRREMEKALIDAMETGQNLLITSDPGAGKTTTAIEVLVRYAEKKTVIYALPTKKKVDEAMDETCNKVQELNIKISKIEGRTEGTKAKDCTDANCVKAEKCHYIGKKGFKPGLIVCPGCEARRSGTCLYQKQFDMLKIPGIVFTTHAQVKNMKVPNDAVVVFDEDPLNVFLSETSATLGEIVSFVHRYKRFTNESETISDIMQKIETAASKILDFLKDEKGLKYGIMSNRKIENVTFKGQSPPTIWEASGISEHERNELEKWISFFSPYEDESSSDWQKRLYFGKVDDFDFWERGEFNIRMLQWFRVLVGDLPGWALVEVHPKEREEPYRFTSQCKKMPLMGAQVIALDGTGKKCTYDRVFQIDFRELSAHVSLNDCRFVHIRRSLGKNSIGKLDKNDIMQILKIAKTELKETDIKILIGTHKKAEETVKQIAAEVFHGRTVETVHFLGNRGLNEYKDFSVFISFGTFTINQLAAWKLAQILFPKDKQLQAEFIRYLSDSENIQTPYRIRPALSAGKTIIICGREWIPGLPGPHAVHDLRKGKSDQIDAAYERIKIFYSIFGFCTKDTAWLLGVGSRTDSDMIRHHSERWPDIMRLLKEKKGVISLICNTLYSKLHLFSGLTVSKPLSAIIFTGREYWETLISRLRMDFPGAGLFRTRQNHSGQWSNGVGSVARVCSFAEASGGLASFDADKWEQLEESTDQYPCGAVLKKLEN